MNERVKVAMKNLITVMSVLSVVFWIIVLCANGMSSQNSIAWQVCELTGFSLWAALFAYGISRFFKSKNAPYGLICFATLFSLIAGIKTLSTSQEAIETEFENTKLALLDMLEKDPLRVSVDSSEKKYSTDEYGDMADVLRIIDKLVTSRVDDMQKYNLKLEESGLEQLFDPTSLCDQLKRAELIEKLNILLAEISILDLNLKKYMLNLDNEIAELPREELRIRCKASMERGNAQSNPLWESYVSIEKEFMQTAIELIEFMNAKEGLFWEEDSILCFEEETDVDLFNNHVEKIMRLAEQEEAVTCKMKDLQERAIEKCRMF